MTNIKTLWDLRVSPNLEYFWTGGELTNLTEDLDTETLFGYINGSCYAIPLEFKALARTLENKIVEAEIAVDHIKNMEVIKLKQVHRPSGIKSKDWTTELYEEYLKLFSHRI